MLLAALGTDVGPLVVLLAVAGACGIAVMPVVVGIQRQRRIEAVAGGVLGLASLSWLGLAFLTEAFCDGTCGRDASTLYVSGSAGLAGCLLLAGALARRMPPAAGWSAVVAGACALGLGVATW